MMLCSVVMLWGLAQKIVQFSSSNLATSDDEQQNFQNIVLRDDTKKRSALNS